MEWTEDIVEELKKLWAEGHTTQKIADMMHTTKGTIIGKVHRLQLPSRITNTNKKDKHVCTCHCEKHDKKKSPCIEIKETSIGGHSDVTDETAFNNLYESSIKNDDRCHSKYGKTLYELKHNECRWPVGDPKSPEFHFCGEKTVNGKTYCAKHCAFAYVTVSSNKDLKDIS